MSASFDQMCGSAGDVRELEYISALHQTTTEEVRQDASINAEDISRFLMSRYGIRVTKEEVNETILEGLGGASDTDDVLDLMEVVAMLLIPIFLKAARKQHMMDHENTSNTHDDEKEELEEPTNKEQAARPSSETIKKEDGGDGLVPTPPGLLHFVLKMILHDVTGDKKPKRLTEDLIRRILICHGEMDLANNDELILEMLEAAAPREDNNNMEDQDLMFTAETFATALTHDVELYDINNETKLTTNFNDVYLTADTVAEGEEEMFATATTNEQLVRMHRRNRAVQAKVDIGEELDRVNTIPFIDTTAGTYRSKGLLVALWATILITYFAYKDFSRELDEFCGENLEYVYNSPWAENSEAIMCESLASIVVWFWFFFSMSVFGVVSVYLGSIGNAVDSKSLWKPLVSGLFVLLLVALPFTLVDRSSDRRENGVLYVASLLFGLLTFAFCMARAAELYFPEARMEDFKSYLPKFDHPILKSTVAEERNVKQATARKLSQMTRNALKINKLKSPDSILNTHYGQALKSYETESRNPKNIVQAGGFWWTWKKFLGRKSEFSRVGIWVPARMISSNLAQYVVALYVIIGGLDLTWYVEREYTVEWAKRQFDEYVDRAIGVVENDEIVHEAVANVTTVFGQYLSDANADGTVDLGCGNIDTTPEEFLNEHCYNLHTSNPVCDPGYNYLCALADPDAVQSLNTTSRLVLMNASGFSTSLLKGTVADAAQEAANASVDTLYPAEKYMVTVPLYVATVVAFLIALFLAVIYVPSVTTTILKLRNGHIATLRNKDFNRYRQAPDQVALLTGSLFWGSLFSSVVVGGAIGLIVFFFVWQASAYYAQRVVAILAGIISVTLVRLAMVLTCRSWLWTSFYRVKPGAANISILALEWGNFALSAGYILARSLKLLLAAATFIGRIDTPFLAPGVGRIGPVELDNYPIVHMKDVLTHEAHRHPYIEQLGVIYLMKLRYKKHFGKRAGTCWRMIFVYALMPWLHRYRIMARDDVRPTADEDDETSSNPDQNDPSTILVVSLRNVNSQFTGDGEADAGQAQAEAMWRIRANLAREGNDTFYRKRNQELEEEVERLRISLAEERSMRNEDLVDKVQRLEEALAAAASRPKRNEDGSDAGSNSSKSSKQKRTPKRASPTPYDSSTSATIADQFQEAQEKEKEGFRKSNISHSPPAVELSLSDLQPIEAPASHQPGFPRGDPPGVPSNFSIVSDDSVNV